MTSITDKPICPREPQKKRRPPGGADEGRGAREASEEALVGRDPDTGVTLPPGLFQPL